MKRKWLTQLVSLMLTVVFFGAALSACTEDPQDNQTKKDAIVIMTEDLSGLFNPYYATSGADQGVVGLTQIGMLTTDSEGQPQAGDNYDTVVKDFDFETVTVKGQEQTVYTFVLKNGLKFSDGVPLTMNDVLFNIYEYLDPSYTGSSTMYSTKILGLFEYRFQASYSGGNQEAESAAIEETNNLARTRLYELRNLFETEGYQSDNSYSLSVEDMKKAINEHEVTGGYRDAVASVEEQKNLTNAQYQAMLLADYENAMDVFKKELESDFKAAKEAYDLTAEPYKSWADAAHFGNDLFKFFYFEGYITPVYNKLPGTSRDDKTSINKFSGAEILNTYKTEEAAINRVFNDLITTNLNEVLTYWGTATTLNTQYVSKAMEVYLLNRAKPDGSMEYPNISGVVSLGHTSNETSVTIKHQNVNKTLGAKNYKVAREYNADGTVKNSDEYAVLQITVEGTDPKAIYNFGFTVAPAHYYAEGGTYEQYYGANNGKSTTTIDIKNNLFGVSRGSDDFQSKVIQSRKHVEVPVGAGAFVATDKNNNDNPDGANFFNSNVVYYKANPNFMFEVKAPKLRMQVVGSSNAIDQLVNGEVDYVTPQFTKANFERLNSLEKDGYVNLSSWQLGYGYIGVNAGKVPDVNVRRAIMSAMQTSLALEFYASGTVKNIAWPMSTVSWAYPKVNGEESKDNGHNYMKWPQVNNPEQAKRQVESKIQTYCPTAYSEKLTFTIAGASITEHPTYPVFKQAAEILNGLGWNVEVKADSQALTKLSTGSLQVWAAAWGSTIDPDMYQVYHKNSTATSVYSWGYREIRNEPEKYEYETGVINELSDLIDDGRETMDQNRRINIYKDAMSLVLDLAVELPVYQRKTLYAYNANNIEGLNSNVNPYSSPLERIWEVKLKG